MDLILISSTWQEKGILQGNEIDFVVEPDAESAEISIQTDLRNADNIQIGDFAAIEGTDFGGKITKMKINYGTGMIEFSGPSWWQYFDTVFCSSTTITNKTAEQACSSIFGNSQFDFYEIIAETGAEATISTEALGVKYSLAESLKIIEEKSGANIKFRYDNNTLKVIVGTSKVHEGINAENTDMQISVDSYIPDYFVLVGDIEKPQQEGQSPIGTLPDGETELYPQSVLFYDCNREQIAQTIDDEKLIKIIQCSANNAAEMAEEAAEKYSNILAACYGVSGDLSEQFPDAEVGDSLHFIDERFGVEFERQFTKKILQETASMEITITYELGEIAYV